MSRRKFAKYGLAAAGALVFGSIANIFPETHAADVLTIPKLSYNPSIGQLMSDFGVQQQMLALDMKDSNSGPVSGKTAIGFDDENVDFLAVYTSATAKPNLARFFISVDKTRDFATGSKDVFVVRYDWEVSAGKKEGWIRYGDAGGFTEPFSPIPQDLGQWDVSFSKSYFAQDQEKVTFAAQIPNSFLGPGDSEGSYGIGTYLNKDGSAQGPNYPPDLFSLDRRTFSTFRAQYPIPEFSFQFPALAVVILAALGLLAVESSTGKGSWRNRR
jgi:hypothetical protein